MIAYQRVTVERYQKKIKFIGNEILTEKQKRYCPNCGLCTHILFQLQAPYSYLRSYLSSDEDEEDVDIASKLTTSESKDPDVTVITGTSNDLSAQAGCSVADDKSTDKPTTENILTDL